MSDEQSISNQTVEDADLVALNDKKSLGAPQVICYFAMVISVAMAGLYLSKYSGGFRNDNYLENPAIEAELAAIIEANQPESGGAAMAS